MCCLFFLNTTVHILITTIRIAAAADQAGGRWPFFGTPSERNRSADQLVHRLTKQEPAPPMSGRPGTSQLPPAALLRATCGPANSTPDPLPPPLPPPVSHPGPPSPQSTAPSAPLTSHPTSTPAPLTAPPTSSEES